MTRDSKVTLGLLIAVAGLIPIYIYNIKVLKEIKGGRSLTTLGQYNSIISISGIVVSAGVLTAWLNRMEE